MSADPLRADDPELPYAVLEQLTVGGQALVRIVGVTNDESEAHTLASTMARAGLRVWLVDLWGQDDGPRIERYVNPAAAVWAVENGVDIAAPGGADRASEAGR